jgi:hypothetical protein
MFDIFQTRMDRFLLQECLDNSFENVQRSTLQHTGKKRKRKPKQPKNKDSIQKPSTHTSRNHKIRIPREQMSRCGLEMA